MEDKRKYQGLWLHIESFISFFSLIFASFYCYVNEIYPALIVFCIGTSMMFTRLFYERVT